MRYTTGYRAFALSGGDWRYRQGHLPTLCLAFDRESRAGSPPPQEAQHHSVVRRPLRQGSHGTEESFVRSGYQSGCLPRPTAALKNFPSSLSSFSLGSRRMPTSRAQVTSLGARERPCGGAARRGAQFTQFSPTSRKHLSPCTVVWQPTFCLVRAPANQTQPRMTCGIKQASVLQRC